jgi:hypothetical protein
MKRPAKVKSVSANQAVTDFLGGYTPEVRDLALAARTFVLKVIPKLIEMVDVKARIIAYGYSSKYADIVCIIMPTKAGVNLGVAYAMELPDPQKILHCIVTSNSSSRRICRRPR